MKIVQSNIVWEKFSCLSVRMNSRDRLLKAVYELSDYRMIASKITICRSIFGPCVWGIVWRSWSEKLIGHHEELHPIPHSPVSPNQPHSRSLLQKKQTYLPVQSFRMYKFLCPCMGWHHSSPADGQRFWTWVRMLMLTKAGVFSSALSRPYSIELVLY